ncbi:hypothetical protein [Streptomyces sp. NPDC048392]|uniref:hypothetical protein n=1 Tax=Streptomyces sp. NPDC048392 TaxID=3365543 RepID=UPI00371B98D0
MTSGAGRGGPLTRDIDRPLPATGIGTAAQVRDGAVDEAQNLERFVISDGPVHSAGDIPV